MTIPKNFWIPPSQGYSSETQGLNELQLLEIEARNGFPLPSAYRTLMQQQNGGTPRYCSLQELVVSDFVCISNSIQDLVTFEDYLLLTCTKEDISALNRSPNFYNPKRLVVFANSGHEVGCFDYGWRSKRVVDEPNIVFFSDDGEEFLHFKTIETFASFDAFLDRLKLSDDVRKKTCIDIESSLNFDDLCGCLEADWQTQFEQKTDDYYGWFNFEKWYCGSVPLYLDDRALKIYAEENNTTFQEVLDWMMTSKNRTRSLVYSLPEVIAAILSPNQHRSGTYLYPDNPELTLVLEISKPWFPIDSAIEQLCTQLIALNDIISVKRIP